MEPQQHRWGPDQELTHKIVAQTRRVLYCMGLAIYLSHDYRRLGYLYRSIFSLLLDSGSDL